MADVLMDYVKHVYRKLAGKLEEWIGLSSVVHKIENATGVPGSYITTGLTISMILIFLLSYGPLFICTTAVVIYPAYQTFKCLQSPDELREETSTWLKYWIVFSFYHAAEHFTDALFWWLPGYTFIKFAFLAFCFAPCNFNGAEILYENYIQPMFLQNSQTVDAMLMKVKGLISQMRSR